MAFLFFQNTQLKKRATILHGSNRHIVHIAAFSSTCSRFSCFLLMLQYNTQNCNILGAALQESLSVEVLCSLVLALNLFKLFSVPYIFWQTVLRNRELGPFAGPKLKGPMKGNLILFTNWRAPECARPKLYCSSMGEENKTALACACLARSRSLLIQQGRSECANNISEPHSWSTG
jgi:hypothetical protein